MKKLLEIHRKGYKLLKMIHQLNHSAVPVFMLWAAAESGWPFIGILFGAGIVDALVAGEWEQSLWLAGGMLGLQLAFGVVLDWLRKESEAISMEINRQCNAHVCLKSISLDYQTFADKKSLEEFSAADYNVAKHGGFGNFLIEYSTLLRNLFSVGISMGLLVDFCLHGAKGDGLAGILLSVPGSFLAMFLLLTAMAVFYGKFAAYVNDHSLEIFQKTMSLSQEMGYFRDQLFYDEQIAKTLRMYHMKELVFQEWEKLSLKNEGFLRKRWRFEDLSKISSGAANSLVLVFSYLLVALKAFAGAVSVGGLAKYAGAVQQMNEAMKNVIESNDKIRLYTSYLAYYTNYLEKKSVLDTGSLPVEKRLDNLYEIEFHDVSFRYPGTEEWVLRHVSVKLDMKKKFAVVGQNGAGKTTFIKLLCRFYDVSEGSITLNGIDIRKYDYQEYMNLFAAVFQDFALFAFAVGENIACSQDPDQDRVWKALRCAGAEEKVKRMSKQLDTPLYFEEEGGESISGGEAQKLAIARALYKDAPFVILDEPTAALDPVSEYEIYSRFDDMVKDKTSVYISHQMSSCRFCQDILVFDQGSLVQRGSHARLIGETEGMYAALWNAQAKYYRR